MHNPASNKARIAPRLMIGHYWPACLSRGVDPSPFPIDLRHGHPPQGCCEPLPSAPVTHFPLQGVDAARTPYARKWGKPARFGQ